MVDLGGIVRVVVFHFLHEAASGAVLEEGGSGASVAVLANILDEVASGAEEFPGTASREGELECDIARDEVKQRFHGAWLGERGRAYQRSSCRRRGAV